MGNMEGLVTGIFKDRKYKFGKLMQIFQNVIIQSLYDVSTRHNRYFSRPCNFAIFETRSSEFGKLGILTCSLKFQYFRSIISFTDTLLLKLFLTLMTSE